MLRKLLIACAVLFALFVIVQFPARVALGWLTPSSVQAFGVSGTVWKGKARIINVAGQQLRNTEWDLALLRVLTGQLGGDFKTRWAGGFAEGFAAVSVTGAVQVRELQAGMDAGMLASLLNTPQLGGQVSVQIDAMQLVDNWPRSLTGKAEIRNLASPLMGRGAADLIGNVVIVFDTATETQPDTVTGLLSDAGGPLELTGTLTLTPPGNYDLDTRIRARPNAPRSITDNLQFLGDPETDGSRIFKLAGSI